MKNVLILTVGFILMSYSSYAQDYNSNNKLTRSIQQTTQSPEQLAITCCELFYNAVKANDLDKVIAITYGIGEWGDDKSDDERMRFENAMQSWADANPYKAERINDFYKKHRDVIPK